MSLRSLFLGSLSVVALGAIGQTALAQVAPTEVNEEAVDEFGLERKTGRFTWSTGEIIGIGPEGARVSIVVTGVRSPAYTIEERPSPDVPVVLVNRPKLSLSAMASRQPLFPGAIDPNRTLVTVEYFGGSHSYECDAAVTNNLCKPTYLQPHTLSIASGDYVFTDKDGVEIVFTQLGSTVNYPDGRQEVYSAAGFRKNNLGYMVRKTPSTGGNSLTYEAINLAEDYCSEDTNIACPSLSGSRSAQFPSVAVSPLDVTDTSGGVTRIRFVEKSARQYRPPTGEIPTGTSVPFNGNLTSRYPVGIKLPGSSAEDITVTYRSHDPQTETHEDIRVSSITKNGVTVSYSLTEYYPFGKFSEYTGSTSGAGEGLTGVEYFVNNYEGTGNPFAPSLPGPDCVNIAPRVEGLLEEQQAVFAACTESNLGAGAGLGTVGSLPEPTSPEFLQMPPEELNAEVTGFSAGVLSDLIIEGRVNGELISRSKSTLPSVEPGRARRRLIYVRDGLGRETQYFTNQYDELAGVTSPEGNSVQNIFDIRGNLVLNRVGAKTDSPAQPIDTSYTYLSDCNAVPIARCNKPLTMTDPMGGVTEYEYNDRGQLTKQISPAPELGAARPTLVNEYTMRQAYIKDATGNAVVAGPPISMLTKSYTCISSATCDASTPATDKIVTEYDYGPTRGLNNLLLRGVRVTAVNAAGQIESQLTCYTYNYFGERISESAPKANVGLTSCPA